ncbi:MAG: glycosyltransferase family 4 protein [Pseudomonadota bacterium]
MSQSSGAIRILHCYSRFGAGDPAPIAVEVMNALGKAAQHTVVSANPDQTSARALMDKRVRASFPTDFPSLTGRSTPGRLVGLARALEGFDLILTYDWGAIDVAMAHTIFGQSFGLAPLVHHESGLHETAEEKARASRHWYRRAALWRTNGLVVRGASMEKEALERWKQPRERITCIPFALDTQRIEQPNPAGLRVVKREGEQWIGTFAAPESTENIVNLVEALKSQPEAWHLVIIGEDCDAGAVRSAATEHSVDDRVHLAGPVNEGSRVLGLFDVFAVTSDRDPHPILQAMAYALPIVAPDTGDNATIIARENRDFVTPPGDVEAIAHSLGALAGDAEGRAEIGAANKAKARAQFDNRASIERHRALYSSVLGRDI